MDSLEKQMSHILDEEERRVREIAEKNIKEISKEAVQKLRNTSPKASEDYAAGWARKKDGKLGMIVHNSKHYQLTHLLENGHVIRNQYGQYDRAPAIVHIKPVEEECNEKLVENIERDISS